jgi:hypothetical protein
MTTKREDIYDNEINPLMAKIIAICDAHDIPMVASFQINDDRGADGEDALHCSTTLTTNANVSPNLRRAAVEIMRQQPSFIAFTITNSEPTR